MRTVEAVVAGCGAVGSAALAELARRGIAAIGFDRFVPPHGRGSTHGQSRIIRKAYFEHPHYVPLLERAFDAWRELEAESGRRLFEPVGLLQVGRADGDVVAGVRASAALHGLPLDVLTPAEAARAFPGFRFADDHLAVFERQAGFLWVEACVEAALEAAKRRGAELLAPAEVFSWSAAPGPPGAKGKGTVVLQTSEGEVETPRLLLTAGSWSSGLLGKGLPKLSVVRKPVFWYRPSESFYTPSAGCPCFLYDLGERCFYGVPSVAPWGLKAAEHSGGDEVADPLLVDRNLGPVDEAAVGGFLRDWLPGVGAELTHASVCLYTHSPDGHFLVDVHPAWPQVAFAAGLSGHGFKFAPVLGELLADWVEGKPTRPEAEFLRLPRLAGA